MGYFCSVSIQVLAKKKSYTNPGVTSSEDKHHPGRWLGISHNVGELLTHKVEKMLNVEEGMRCWTGVQFMLMMGII